MKARISLYLLCFILCFACSKNGSKKGNDLVNETSPYLLQHAYNPVNWKAWNESSLEEAKEQNKLIVISIGYASCHWCHVMEEESFENDSIAKIMNDNFINIKVDREERPDVDKVYMNAVQLMTGGGGWPLNCIALPDGRPIYGGTYFTKEQWSKVLKSISKLYKEEPQKAIEFAENLTKGIQESQLITLNKETPSFTKKEITSSVALWRNQMDTIYGGFKGAPKFPMPNSLEFLKVIMPLTDIWQSISISFLANSFEPVKQCIKIFKSEFFFSLFKISYVSISALRECTITGILSFAAALMCSTKLFFCTSLLL